MNVPTIVDTVIWPIKWLIEAILVGAHALLAATGLPPEDGIAWVLAILALVVGVRTALIPLFVRQLRSRRAMLRISPQLGRIQARYQGRRDKYSREALSRETVELYRREGVRPLASLVPLLVQLPVLFSLFSVLSGAERAGSAGVGLLTRSLSHSFAQATLFGAPLRDSIATAHTAGAASGLVVAIAVVFTVVIVVSQLAQQSALAAQVPPEVKAAPTYRQQRVVASLLPLVFVYSGIAFPLAVMSYLLFSNLWTTAQQFLALRT